MRSDSVFIACFAALSAVAVGGSAPADATFPGRSGRIAFTNFEFSAEDNSYVSQVISIRPDGSAPRVLAAGLVPDCRSRPFAKGG